MASINPNLPPIPGTTPARPLSHLSPVKSTPQPETPAPGDSIHIQAPQPQDPVSPVRSQAWLKKAALGATGLGLLAAGAILGGGLGPSLSGGSSPAPQAHVQIQQQQKAAPTRMLQDQNAPIHLKTARFGVSPSVRSFGNSGVRHEIDKRVEAKEMPGGGELTHDIRIDRIHGADGHVLYSSDDAELGTLDFHDQATVNWKTRSELKPAGHFGHYVSVSETTVRYTGGDSDAAETRLRTIDLNTRNVVNLSELLTSEDYVRIARDVQAGLNSLQGANYQVADMETLDSHMNNGFALNQEKDGSLTLTVAIPSQVESEVGKVAEFVFSIPSSALQR